MYVSAIHPIPYIRTIIPSRLFFHWSVADKLPHASVASTQVPNPMPALTAEYKLYALHNLNPQSISIRRTGFRNHLMRNPKGNGAQWTRQHKTEVNDVSTRIESYHPISPPAHIALSPSCSPGPDCSVAQSEWQIKIFPRQSNCSDHTIPTELSPGLALVIIIIAKVVMGPTARRINSNFSIRRLSSVTILRSVPRDVHHMNHSRACIGGYFVFLVVDLLYLIIL